MSARILIVEDEEALTMLLRYNLEAEGYDVDTVARGDDAEMRLQERMPDLVLLDWMLPGLSGIELCRRLRARPETSAAADHHADGARRGERARARARHRRRRLHRQAVLGAGAAGAREGLLRRASPERLATAARRRHRARPREAPRRAPGRPIDLGPTEFRLLEFLLEHPGRVFSREQLLDGVWGRDVYIDERTVDVHVGRLRKPLNPGREQDPIRTVRGAGYAFDDRFAKVES